VKITDAMAAFPSSGFDGAVTTAPALVLYGEHTPATLRAMHARVPEWLPNADVEVQVVPDAGHASNVDNPEFVTEAVRGFLDRVHEGRSDPIVGDALQLPASARTCRSSPAK